MPYIYTYARETTKTGLPLVRAMVLEYQDDPNTYSAYGQYLLGRELLVAPLWSDTTFERVDGFLG
jgi:alpha-glucosidase (family GH31 glycosyl hydrolase)